MKTILMLFLLCCPSLWSATIEGSIQISYTKSRFDENDFQTKFGDTVKATTRWYADDFFGDEAVFAGVTVKNTGTKPMRYYYDVAFFDKNHKLVGATTQDSGTEADDALKTGGETPLASCIICLPKGKYKEIAFYQAVIYESPADKN